MTNVCKICGRQFTERGLHGHIIKAHDMAVPLYYETHLPRFDKLTKEKIPFIEYHSYVEADFVSRANEKKWLKETGEDEAREYLKRMLAWRIKLKKLKYAPSFVEFETSELPPYKAYVHFFGSYHKACQEIGVEPLLCDRKDVPIIASHTPEVLIDSREQRPLKFKKSREQKLAFGDYTLSGEDYTYTYVDRKSAEDFKGTVTMNQERFLRELQRCVDMDCYLYVVVEESIARIELLNKMAAYHNNMNYVWSSMRKIQHLYPQKCQFIFTGSRENSEKIIPYLLMYGKELWNTDVQYLLTVKGVI